MHKKLIKEGEKCLSDLLAFTLRLDIFEKMRTKDYKNILVLEIRTRNISCYVC